MINGVKEDDSVINQHEGGNDSEDDHYKNYETNAQFDNVNMQKPCVNLMVLIEFLLEYIALFDFITDLIVSLQLFTSKYTGWAILTINAMFAPLYVSTI